MGACDCTHHATVGPRGIPSEIREMPLGEAREERVLTRQGTGLDASGTLVAHARTTDTRRPEGVEAAAARVRSEMGG